MSRLDALASEVVPEHVDEDLLPLDGLGAAFTFALQPLPLGGARSTGTCRRVVLVPADAAGRHRGGALGSDGVDLGHASDAPATSVSLLRLAGGAGLDHDLSVGSHRFLERLGCPAWGKERRVFDEGVTPREGVDVAWSR